MGKACSKQFCKKEYENEDDQPEGEFAPGDTEPIKLSTYSGNFGGVPPVGYVDTPTTHESLTVPAQQQSATVVANRASRKSSRARLDNSPNPMQHSRYTNRSSGTRFDTRNNSVPIHMNAIPTIAEEPSESRGSNLPLNAIASAKQSNYDYSIARKQDAQPSSVVKYGSGNMDPNGFSIYKQLESVNSESSKIRFAEPSIGASNISKGRSGSLQYTGNWKGQLKHGMGTQIWPDGSTYEGAWVDGKATGHGRFRLSNGDIYEGEFSNDMANGKGVLIRHDGSRYEGTWWDDLQHGTGVEIWPNGSRYQGGYHRGKKHGYGRYIWPDRSEYAGDWQGNAMAGYGRMVWADGRRYDGQWLNNQKHGIGKHFWPDGRRYEGEYRMDARHGHGKLVLPDGSSYIGEWSENKRHGRGVESAASGAAREGTWDHGRPSTAFG